MDADAKVVGAEDPGLVGGPFLAPTHLEALWVVVTPAIVQALLPLIVFWYPRRPVVEAFFAR